MAGARAPAKDLDEESSAWPRRGRTGVAAHLEACGPCNEDFTGLLAAVARG